VIEVDHERATVELRQHEAAGAAEGGATAESCFNNPELGAGSRIKAAAVAFTDKDESIVEESGSEQIGTAARARGTGNNSRYLPEHFAGPGFNGLQFR
jgi:hypothetical protein